MKILWKYIAIFFSIVIAVLVTVYLIVFRKADDSVAGLNPKYKLSCSVLVNEFEKDEDLANAKYLDKIVEIEGTIAELSSDTSGVHITLHDENATSGITCSFSISQNIDIKELKLGSTIVIKGICTGFSMDVTLNKGTIVKN
jgi:hypothetical protein